MSNSNSNSNTKPNREIRPDNRVKKYDFSQINHALVAYLASLDLRINNIIEEGVPVFAQGLDASYYMNQKYVISNNEDLYMTIPRVVVKFDEIQDTRDMLGSQDVKYRYIFNEKTYEAFFRRKQKTMTVTNSFVASNYIRAMEYYEIIESLMRRVYPFTYEFLGNSEASAYELTSNIITNPTMDASSTPKDFVVNFTTELQIILWAINYDSIKEINVFKDVNEGDGFGGSKGKTEVGADRISWRINSKIKDKDGRDLDHISKMETPHNPDCIGCRECMDFL